MASRLGLMVLLGTAVAAAFGACSLGDGVTPACDPSAAPDTANACLQTADCDVDPADGFSDANPDCCNQFASVHYAILCQVDENGPASDYTTECESVEDGDTCGPSNTDKDAVCNTVLNMQYNPCILGQLGGTVGSGGGGGGTGGDGGSGGSGGDGGDGGGTGGGGGSGGSGGGGGAGGT